MAEIELEDLPSFIEQCSIIYITELGYLLSVPIWKGDGSDASDYTLPNFEVKVFKKKKSEFPLLKILNGTFLLNSHLFSVYC